MTKPSDSLKQRGIDEQARLAGWIETPNYWEYRVIAPDGSIIATRYKKYPFAPEPKKMKYHWGAEGKPENLDAQWYIQEDTKQAIEAAQGVAYLSNGEPAMLAYRAAGILNALATTLSEVAVPKEAISYLRRMGISRLIYIIDKDEAGLKSAQNWHDELAGTGIDLELRQWPSYLAEKADGNDAWIAAEFLPQGFQIILRDTSILSVTTTERNQAPKKSPVTQDFDKSGLVCAIHAALEQSNLTGRKIRQGQWLEVHCPFHDDKEPSAGFNLDSGVLNCMGKCGRGFSPKELAIHFNIDWKAFFPKSEPKQKPKKAEIKAFEQSLDTIAPSKDERSYEDVLQDEIMGREIAYGDKQFIGFGRWAKLPLGVLSAVLTLSVGRSDTAMFLGRLHEALVSGKLGAAFTIDEAALATKTSYNVSFKGCFELSHLSFLSKLRGIFNKDSIRGKVSQKNSEGRPKDIYLVEFEALEITAHLNKMLEIFHLERSAKKALAMPSMQMARQLGLGESDLRAWRERVKLALEDSVNKQAKRAFDTEMLGNGGTWKGWTNALNSPYAAPLDYAAYEDCQDLRAALLTWWVKSVRQVNSREELCRLLGCTDPVIDKLLDKANLASDKQTVKVDIPKLPDTVKGMGYEWNRIQRDLHGKSWQGGFWDTQAKAWIPFESYQDCVDTYSKFAGRISKAYMLVQTPSKQRPMTLAEIEKRNEERALVALEAQEESASSLEVTPKTDTPKAASSAKSEKYTYLKWDKHTYKFLYSWVRLATHCFTPHALEGHSIKNKAGEIIFSGELDEIQAWLSANASEKQLRKVKSFYGKSYDEDIDLAQLQALADERKAMFGIVESVEFDDLPEDLPIFAEMPKQVVLNFELSKPAPIATNHGYVYGTPDNPEYYDYLNNPYVSAWEQANREANVKKWKAELEEIAS